MAKPHTAAVILARGGSKGIPQKNLKTVGGLSLVARGVRAALGAQSVDSVWVSTDDRAIAEEARRFGARVIDRPADLSGDTASSEVGWRHAQDHIAALYPCLARLVLLQCTSPFTQGQDIDQCLAAMARAGADCAISVCPDHYFYWRRDGAGLGYGTNHNHTQPRKRRQDLPDTFRETGAIYCVDAARFAETGQRFCGPVALCEIDRTPLEIDSLSDLETAEALCLAPANVGVAADELSNIRQLVMDFDGVHTDDKVTTDQNGIESVVTSRRDGLGLGRLRAAGRIRLLIVSKERNPVVTARAAKLGIEVLQGIDDKVTAITEWLDRIGGTAETTLFVGNDVNDMPALKMAGLSACPSDAVPQVLNAARWVVPFPGGHGALRHICDALLDAGQG